MYGTNRMAPKGLLRRRNSFVASTLETAASTLENCWRPIVFVASNCQVLTQRSQVSTQWICCYVYDGLNIRLSMQTCKQLGLHTGTKFCTGILLVFLCRIGILHRNFRVACLLGSCTQFICYSQVVKSVISSNGWKFQSFHVLTVLISHFMKWLKTCSHITQSDCCTS